MKILAALDGSQQSLEALKLAVALPIEDKEFILLHVSPSVAYNAEFVAEEYKKTFAEFNQDMQENAEGVLAVGEELLKGHGLSYKKEILNGQASELIPSYVEREGVELIALGRRGLNPVASFFLGSCADTLLRSGKQSILFPALAGGEVLDKFKVVLGYDQSVSAGAACRFVAEWSPAGLARLDILAIEKLHFYYGLNYSIASLASWPEKKKSLEEVLVGLEMELRQQHPQLDIRSEILVNITDVAYGLEEYAKKQGSHLVVIGSKDKGAVERLLLGSVANRLAHNCALPVLIFR